MKVYPITDVGAEAIPRWIEINRAGKSRRLHFNLAEVPLADAARHYADTVRPSCYIYGERASRFVDLCRTHYECRTPNLIGPLRYSKPKIDIDASHDDPMKAVEAALKAAEKIRDFLWGAGSKMVNVFFSGSRGTGIEWSGTTFWPKDAEDNLSFIQDGQLIMGRFIFLMMKELGIPSLGHDGEAEWDPGLYNRRAPVRIPGVPHRKSLKKFGRQLYRTLLPDDFHKMSVDEIIEYSSRPRRSRPLPAQDHLHVLTDLWNKAEIATIRIGCGGAGGKKKGGKRKAKAASTLTIMVDAYGEDVVKTAIKDIETRGGGAKYPPCITSIRAGVLQGKSGIRNRTGVSVCSFHATLGESLSDALGTMTHVPTTSDIKTETTGQWDSITRNKGYYSFGPAGCFVLRGLGAACDHTCPLHSILMQTAKPKTVPPTRKQFLWPPFTEISMEDAREELVQEIVMAVDDVLLAGPPGIGKSLVACGAGVRAAEKMPVVYSAPTRNLLGQAVRRVQGIEVKHGRNDSNCIHADWADKIGGRGWNATRAVCARCEKFGKHDPLQSNCGYWQQWASKGRYWAVTHAHLRSGLPQKYLEPALYLIDENPLDAALGDAGGGMVDWRDLVALAGLLPWQAPAGVLTFGLGEEPSSDTDKLLMRVAQGLQRLELGRHRGASHVAEGRVVGPAAPLLVLFWDEAQPLRAEDLDLVRRVKRQLDAGEVPEPQLGFLTEGERPPPNVLVPLIEALGAAVESYDRGQRGEPPVAVPVLVERTEGVTDGEKVGAAGTIVATSRWGLTIRVFEPLDIPAAVKVLDENGRKKQRATRVVCLDATTNKKIIEKVTRRRLREVRQHIRPLGTWTQIVDARVPKATLLHDKKTRKRWLDRTVAITRQLREQHGKVLVVAPMDFAHALRGELQRHHQANGITIGHYYGIRGMSLEDHNACLLVGFPQPPRDAVYLDAAAIWLGEVLDATWEPVWLPYLDVEGPDKDGHWLGSEVEMPRDERLRVVWRMRSQDEIYQAAFRIRGLSREVLSLILTSAPMPPEYRLPVSLLTLRELTDGSNKEQKTSVVAETLMRTIQERLGWCSLHLLSAVLAKRSLSTSLRQWRFAFSVSPPLSRHRVAAVD